MAAGLARMIIRPLIVLVSNPAGCLATFHTREDLWGIRFSRR